MPRPLKQNGLARKLAGKAASVGCEGCCDPIPGEPWIEGTLCDCSGSSQPRAWMRSSDYLRLRRRGGCPTGKLPDGSCWEVLEGADTRPTEPSPAQRLQEAGVRGCCVCCDICDKETHTLYDSFWNPDTCGEEATSVEDEVCCGRDGVVEANGYTVYEEHEDQDFKGCFGGPPIEYKQAWWRCGHLPGGGYETWITAVRRASLEDGRCLLVRDETYRIIDDRGGKCDSPWWGASAAGERAVRLDGPIPGLTAIDFRVPCDDCGKRSTYRGIMTPSSVVWSSTSFRRPPSRPDECVRYKRSQGYHLLRPPPSGPCASLCNPLLPFPAVPPPPVAFAEGGLGGGGVFVPDRRVTRAQTGSTESVSGCSSCGGDGGL